MISGRRSTHVDAQTARHLGGDGRVSPLDVVVAARAATCSTIDSKISARFAAIFFIGLAYRQTVATERCAAALESILDVLLGDYSAPEPS